MIVGGGGVGGIQLGLYGILTQKYVQSYCILERMSFENGGLKILLFGKPQMAMHHIFSYKPYGYLCCELCSTLYEYSHPKHKYDDLKMLIGLAEFLCMDERKGYISRGHECLCMCGMCAFVCLQELVCLGAGGRPI